MSKSGRVAALLLVFIVAFCVWYSLASNYDYDDLAGSYVRVGGGETCKLFLRRDHTFKEELDHSGSSQIAEGTWRRYGQAHVSFSKTFLKVNGEELNASGEAHGEFEKPFGVLPSLTLAPIPGGPIFRKSIFH